MWIVAIGLTVDDQRGGVALRPRGRFGPAVELTGATPA